MDRINQWCGKKPKSGWNDFLKKSIGLGILSLQDCGNIPGYSFGMGSAKTASFEIATGSIYRFYRMSVRIISEKELRKQIM